MYRVSNNSVYGDWPWGVERIRVKVATGLYIHYKYTPHMHIYNYSQ